jgi:hypothetical protein
MDLVKGPALGALVTPTPGVTPAIEIPSLPIPAFPVDRVLVADGRLVVNRKGPSESVLQKLQLSVTRTRGGFWVQGRFLPPGAASGGWAKIEGRVKPETQDVQGRFQVQSWPLRSLSTVLQEAASLEPLGGALDGDFPFHYRQGVPFAYQSRWTVRDGSVRPAGSTGPVLSRIQAQVGVRP